MKDAKGHGSNAHNAGVQALSYEAAKGQKAHLEAEHERASGVLRALSGGGPFGMTPDSVKSSPEYKTATANFNRAHGALQNFNRSFLKTFKNEYAAERRAKREGR